MKSPITGGEVRQHIQLEKLAFRGDTLTVPYINYECVDTEKEFTTREVDEQNLRLLHNAYREKHNIPFPDEIIETRNKYGVSQTKMSQILGFGVNTYREYENGNVPQLNNAKLIARAAKPKQFIDLVDECDSLSQKDKKKFISKAKTHIEYDAYPINEFLFKVQEPDSYTGYKKPSIHAFSEMVAFLAEDIEPYKVKMNKLLYYADSYHFKEHGQSISGACYQAIQMGPVPYKYGTLFEYGEELGYFTIKRTYFEEFDIEGEQFVSNKADFEHLSEIEISTLRLIKKELGHLPRKELERISHEEVGWLENEKERKMINYFSALLMKFPKD
jgi:putative zinc finger/helix-turn-helix YgiT family protein